MPAPHTPRRSLALLALLALLAASIAACSGLSDSPSGTPATATNFQLTGRASGVSVFPPAGVTRTRKTVSKTTDDEIILQFDTGSNRTNAKDPLRRHRFTLRRIPCVFAPSARITGRDGVRRRMDKKRCPVSYRSRNRNTVLTFL